MNQIDLGGAILEAFMQPAVIKIWLAVILVAFAMLFLGVLKERFLKRIEKKYSSKKMSDSLVVLLFLLFASGAVLVWKLM